MSELVILKKFEKNNIFEVVSNNENGIYGGKKEISFTIYNNNLNLLSLGFHETSCGMTCAYWVKYYNFNPGNGDLVQLKDLFTVNGYRTFTNYAKNKRLREFKKQLLEVDTAHREYFDNIIDCYKEDDLSDFFIIKDSLFVDGDNCLSKSQKFEGIETITKFKLSEFKNYLNAYGKCIFSLTSDMIGKYRSHSLPQLFQGTLGSNDILLVLRKGHGKQIFGEYLYLKHGHGIDLDGTLEKNKLVLTERSSAFDDIAEINAVFDGETITGTWKTKDGSKTYKVVARRK